MSGMDEAEIPEIARELCDLLDQQLKAISGCGFEDLTDEEMRVYEDRKKRVTALRSKLAVLERCN